MKHTAGLLRMLCGMVVMLVLVASIAPIPALAASNGIYIAAATPHYRHPVTGVIEDSGGDGSAVLGQSMTESALYRQALVEVDPQGNTYVTVRLKLMDNIQDPQFQVDGSPVSAVLMQEDYSDWTSDYRMMVNSESSVIRCNMYVIPMGREVIFYITVSDLQSGSGDFISSVTVEEPSQPETPAEPEQPSQPEAPAQPTEQPTQPETPTQPEQPSPQEPTDEAKPEPKDASAVGLQEFDASGNPVDEPAAPTQQTSGSAVWWVLGITLALAAGGCVWYFGFFRKKR